MTGLKPETCNRLCRFYKGQRPTKRNLKLKKTGVFFGDIGSFL